MNEELLLKMLEELEIQQPHYLKLQRYYNGEHDYVLNKQKSKSTDENHKISINWPGKIVDSKLGYFLGKPVSYSSKIEDDPLLQEIEYYYNDWEEQHNVNLYKNAAIFGKAYELVTVNSDGEFECFAFSPLEMIALTDGTKKKRVQIAVRKYKKQYDDNEYVDVITDTEIIQYQLITDNEGNKSLIELNRKNHIFSRCPVLLYQNNSEEKGDFEKVLPIIDAYDYVCSRNVDEIAYFSNSYFVIEGAEGTDNEELLKMKTNRIIKTPQGSKAYFAIKDINGEFIEKVLDRFEKEIIQQSNIAILSTAQLSSNISGVALKTKLQEMENVVSINEVNLKSLLYQRLKFFTEFLEKRKNKKYDYRNIIITFSRNIPSNLKEIADITAILQGIVSKETLLSNIPFVKSPEMELRKIQQEQGQEMSPEEIKNLLDEVLKQYDDKE